MNHARFYLRAPFLSHQNSVLLTYAARVLCKLSHHSCPLFSMTQQIVFPYLGGRERAFSLNYKFFVPCRSISTSTVVTRSRIIGAAYIHTFELHHAEQLIAECASLSLRSGDLLFVNCLFEKWRLAVCKLSK